MYEFELRQFEKNLEESIKRAEASFQIRQDTLDGIYQELVSLNQYLQVIVKEVQDMNRGIIIKDDNE